MKKFAFTLAEVMITLGIVGVIAVLTLPNLMSGTNDKTRAAVIKVTFEQLSNAVKGAMLDENVHYWTDSEIENTSDGLNAFLKQYLDVTKICESFTDCFASGYKSRNGSSVGVGAPPFKAFAKLSTGASVAMYAPTDSEIGAFLVDANGKDLPNVFGKDLFWIQITNKGDVGSSADNSTDAGLKAVCDDGSSMTSCFRLLQTNNWSMDY